MSDPATGQQQGQGEARTFTAEDFARQDANWREVTARKDAAAKAAEQKLAEYIAQREADDKAKREKDMTEVEKAKARADAAEAEKATLAQRFRESKINAEIRVEAIRVGIDPDDAARLFDASTISYDDKTGSVSGVAEGIKALVEKKPYLRANAVPAGQTPDNSRGYRGGATITKEILANIPPGDKRTALFREINEGRLSVVD